MNINNSIPVFVSALLYLITQSAAASNLRWLDNAPVRYFTDKDWELLNTARNRALSEAKDGETVSWENPESKSSGSLTPLSTYSSGGLKCRSLEISNKAIGSTGNTIFEFCQNSGGKWGAIPGNPAKP